MRMILLALLVGLAGCCCSSKSLSELSGGHTISIAAGVGSSARTQIIEAARTHIAAFEALEGVVVPPTRIIVSNASRIPCGGSVWPFAIGCWHGDEQVSVTRGSKNELPALYHELAHRTYSIRHSADYANHWKTWDERGDLIAEAIRLRRLRLY